MERILAIDLGSGKLKAVCADVVESDGERSLYGDPVFEHFEPIGFAKALGEKDKIPSNVFELAAKKLKKCVKRARQEGATAVVVVATEALRRASNHKKIIKRIEEISGLKVTIIKQDEEARLGFLTAQKISGLDPEELICWDSGSASFQISWMQDGKLQRHCGRYGKIPATALLVRSMRNHPFSKESSSNPVKAEELTLLVDLLQNGVAAAKPALRQKLEHGSVIGIGTQTSTFGLCAKAVKGEVFEPHELWNASLSCLNREDQALKERFPGTSGKRIVPALALVYAVMTKLEIPQVRVCKSIGSAVGILCSPQYWNNQDSLTRL